LQVDPEDIINHLSSLQLHEAKNSGGGSSTHLTPYSTPYASQQDVPRYQIPQEGAPADTVYSMLKDELDLDGRPNLNLASFVNTYIEDRGQQLMIENIAKNLADNDEYPPCSPSRKDA